MIKKLRWKFIFTNMVCVLIMLMLFFVLTVSMTGRDMARESLAALREAYIPDKYEKDGFVREEQDFVEGNNFRPSGNGEQRPKEEKKGEKGHHIPVFYLRYDSAGSLVVGGNDVFDLSDPSYLTGVLEKAVAQNEDHGFLWSENLIFMRVQREGNDLYVFGDITAEKNTLENLLLDSLLIGCIGLLGFFLISLLLARWAVKPTEQAWAKQRQFVGDASHELKTPLTVIGTNVELLQGDDLTEEKRVRCVESIAAMSRQMRALTEELLTLARTDDSNSDYPMELLDLGTLVEDAAMSFEALFFERGLTLETAVPSEPVQCKGHESHLRQLVEILLDNAQKYSLPGEARVELVQQHNRAILTVSNPAEPLDQEVLQRLFDRFYQADSARSAGYGLGLSIAQNIVRCHGGQISATCQDGQITFRVRLPLH